MSILIINLLVVTLSSFIAEIMTTKSKVHEKYFICITAISLIIVSGFRYMVGTDYMAYYKGYLSASTEKLQDAKDVGFLVLNKLLNNISSNPQMIFLVTSIIINICVVLFLYKNSIKFSLSIYFYITTFTYYSSMNGVRQFLATSIILLAYRCLVERNFIKYSIYVLIASTIHGSALLMIPIYFLVNQKIFSIKNLFIIASAIFAYIFFQPVFSWLMNSVERFSEYNDYLFVEGQGVNILRVLVLLAPLIAIIIFIKKKNIEVDKNLQIIINLCLIGLLFMILACRHMFIARFCIFFEFYYLLLIPRLCVMFDKKSNRLITFSLMTLYFAYSVMLLVSGDCRILPFEFNFTLF